MSRAIFAPITVIKLRAERRKPRAVNLSIVLAKAREAAQLQDQAWWHNKVRINSSLLSKPFPCSSLLCSPLRAHHSGPSSWSDHFSARIDLDVLGMFKASRACVEPAGNSNVHGYGVDAFVPSEPVMCRMEVGGGRLIAGAAAHGP